MGQRGRAVDATTSLLLLLLGATQRPRPVQPAGPSVPDSAPHPLLCAPSASPPAAEFRPHTTTWMAPAALAPARPPSCPSRLFPGLCPWCLTCADLSFVVVSPTHL